MYINKTVNVLFRGQEDEKKAAGLSRGGTTGTALASNRPGGTGSKRDILNGSLKYHTVCNVSSDSSAILISGAHEAIKSKIG
jgi:hypothetical protein